MRPDVVRSLHLIEPPLLDLLPEQPLVQEMDRRVQWIVEHHAEIGDEAATEAFFAMIGAERALERLRGRPIGIAFVGMPPGSRVASRPALTRALAGEARRHHPGRTLHRRAEPSRASPDHRGAANRIDGARLLDVPEAGHAVQMAKEVFIEALLALAHEADLDGRERVSLARTIPTGNSGRWGDVWGNETTNAVSMPAIPFSSSSASAGIASSTLSTMIASPPRRGRWRPTCIPAMLTSWRARIVPTDPITPGWSRW